MKVEMTPDGELNLIHPKGTTLNIRVTSGSFAVENTSTKPKVMDYDNNVIVGRKVYFFNTDSIPGESRRKPDTVKDLKEGKHFFEIRQHLKEKEQGLERKERRLEELAADDENFIEKQTTHFQAWEARLEEGQREVNSKNAFLSKLLWENKERTSELDTQEKRQKQESIFKPISESMYLAYEQHVPPMGTRRETEICTADSIEEAIITIFKKHSGTGKLWQVFRFEDAPDWLKDRYIQHLKPKPPATIKCNWKGECRFKDS